MELSIKNLDGDRDEYNELEKQTTNNPLVLTLLLWWFDSLFAFQIGCT
jgi:hypothetical protein